PLLSVDLKVATKYRCERKLTLAFESTRLAVLASRGTAPPPVAPGSERPQPPLSPQTRSRAPGPPSETAPSIDGVGGVLEPSSSSRALLEHRRCHLSAIVSKPSSTKPSGRPWWLSSAPVRSSLWR